MDTLLQKSSLWNCPQVTLWTLRQSQECRCSIVLEAAAVGNRVDVARAWLGVIFKKRDERNVLRRALDAIWRRRDSAGQDDWARVCGALSQGRRETSRSWLQGHHGIIENALHTALEYGSEEVAVILMEHIPLKGVDEEILHNALKGGCFEIAERLLREGVAVRDRDSEGNEPLHCLLQHSYRYRRSDTELRHLVLLLLERGADANSEDWFGERPLHLAAQRGMTQCIECLINAGADFTLTNRRGRTPVHEAASGGHVSALRCLIRAGADPCARDSRGKLPLHLTDSTEVVHFLLEGREGDCGATDIDGRTPLHCAAQRGDEEAVQALVDGGADPAAVDLEGRQPIFYLIKGEEFYHRDEIHSIGALLLNEEMNVNAVDQWGQTLLHNAASRCAYSSVLLLLEKGADTTLKDHQGRTAEDLLRAQEGAFLRKYYDAALCALRQAAAQQTPSA